MEYQQWCHDVIRSIIDDNDNIQPPIVRVIFDQHNIPTKNIIPSQDSPYLYEDEHGFVLNNNDIFHNTLDVPQHSSYGHIFDESDIQKQLQNQDILEQPTSYVCIVKSTPQDTNNLTSHISSIINDTTTKGLYQFQLSNEMQNDGGANRSVTSSKNILLHYKSIDPYPINGINSNTPAIHCIGFGYIPWCSRTNDTLLIPCYYCPQASGTIISPTDIVFSHLDKFVGWQMTTNVDKSTGTFILLAQDGVNHITYPTHMKNNLWYHYMTPTAHTDTYTHRTYGSVINSLNATALYELWHHRLGHPGKNITEKFYTHTIGVPILRANTFYTCNSCLRSKFHNRSIKHIAGTSLIPQPTKGNNETQLPDKPCAAGQHLHMDYGFVRGSDWHKKDNDGKLVTSVDKYRSYLLVIDRCTRYIWIYLTKSKSPPLDFLSKLLCKFANPNLISTVTTDQGGELAKSFDFASTIDKCGYILTPTGAYASAQNGLAEKPNKDLAQIMRNLLYSAGLGSEFWSYALRHAVYLKNRWPHSSLSWKTPYEALNGIKPNFSNIRVFGSIAHIKTKSRRYMKLDTMSDDGLFMTYTGTDKNIYVVNKDGSNERISTHVAFDEAHTSSTNKQLPPMAIILQQAGYIPTENSDEIDSSIKVQILHRDAIMPQKGTIESAGYDICCHSHNSIPPHSQKLIDTGLAIEIPQGCFGQLKSRSGLALKYNVHVKAGTIDSDYRGELKILLSNESSTTYTFDKHTRIAQLVIFKLPQLSLEQVDQLSVTQRDKGGFGSTGLQALHHSTNTPSQPTTAAAAQLRIDDDDHVPYNVVLSEDPFQDQETITIPVRGKHPTQGIILTSCDVYDGRLIISAIQPGTSPRNIKGWFKRIKHSHLLRINNCIPSSLKHANEILQHISLHDKSFTITVSQDQKRALHHEHGIPMLYFDQLATISKHLSQLNNQQISNNTPIINQIDQSNDEQNKYLLKMMHAFKTFGTLRAAKAILPKNKRSSTKLTRQKLKKLPSWPQWQKSEYKQLNQYHEQDMFGEPCQLPPGANVLDLLWTYLIKTDGTLKARCVCNGQPKFKGTVIFGYTFAKMLDHVGSRIFWGTVAAKNLIVRGADASNAFAEASAPDIPLYVRVDTQYREWYKHKFDKDIPEGYVLPVRKALQGHPESSRLWAIHMDKILRETFNLKPTTHEGCLYSGKYKNQDILFLRQVDDFAVAATDEQTCIDLISEIDQHMTIDIKDLGRLSRYNGVDITQSKYYIKLSNATYIDKLLEEHDWLLHDTNISNIPLPVKNDQTFNQRMETAIPPITDDSKLELQNNMGINYRQAIGELIFLMVTCRPDISYPLIKLSQYSSNPAAEHYESVKHILRYIKATKHDGIYFWRRNVRDDLPDLPLPKQWNETYNVDPNTHIDSADLIHGLVDSDWGGDSNHRRSVTGIIIKYAGGTIYFKTKFQETIVLSSTEAEFIAACDAGKAILYVRSILNEIGVDQNEATTLFIDNNGALLMGNAQQPTRRTRHMDIKHFSLLDWIERDLIFMKRINTSDNSADALTKSLGRTLFYRHNDSILGKIIPPYAAAYNVAHA